jgi:hypothetical protein
MIQALILECGATAAFAAVYLLAGWVNPYVTPHYYEVARRPELASPARKAASWLLRGVLVYALMGWIAEIVAMTHILVAHWPWLMTFVAYVATLFLACVALLMIVWIAFKLGSEYTALPPEFLVAIVLGSFEVFVFLPRAHFVWGWLPGLH